MSIELREYQAGDEQSILELFASSFGRALAPGFWQWRYRDNPLQEQLIELAWHGDRLVAHYAACPIRVCVEGEVKKTALSMTTMTHPDFRGQGLFGRLATRLYERMQHDGYYAIWGFPNAQSHRGFIRDLAWRDIAEIPTFRWHAAASQKPSPACEILQSVQSADPRFDQLWTRVKGRFAFSTVRDARFVQWRFFDAIDSTYHVQVLEDHDAILGYVVLKPYEHDWDLVDLLAINVDIAIELVKSVLSQAQRAQIAGVNTWGNFSHSLHREMEKLGFANDAPITYLGGRILDESSRGRLPQYSDVYLTMADSDVY